MTLAAILLAALFTAPGLLCKGDPYAVKLIFRVGLANSASMQDTATPEAKTQDQGTTTPAQNPPNSSKPAPSVSNPSQTSTSQTHSTAPKRPRRKKQATANCDVVPAQASAGQTPTGQATTSNGSTTASGASDSKAASGQSPSAASTSDNCPPAKKIVRQGGSSEPTIQLVGGKNGPQSSADKDTANQLRGSAEENLKKIAGQQLTSSQQDMVEQIHQFVSQSKTAEDAGDTERARKLALKAQLLSEELVKPQP
jgi:hypothetical protein